jgi:hypothetical protein
LKTKQDGHKCGDTIPRAYPKINANAGNDHKATQNYPAEYWGNNQGPEIIIQDGQVQEEEKIEMRTVKPFAEICIRDEQKKYHANNIF